MKKGIYTFCILLLWMSLSTTAASPEAGQDILLKEDFNNLESWKPLNFPKIENHSSYTIESKDQESYLRAESKASASALVYKKEFNVYEYPDIRWRWKVENVYETTKIGTREGDDFPVRIYVNFKYDPKKAAFYERLRYGSAKLLYGEYPPHSALNYVWASDEVQERIIVSPYTEKARLIILQQGGANAGAWQKEDINIVRDYQEAFGEAPPPVASIAIMNDSDNTGESSVSYIDDIEIYRSGSNSR